MLAFGKAAAWKFRYCFRNFLTQLKGSNWSSMAVELSFYLYLEFVYLKKMEQSVFWFVSRSAKKNPCTSFAQWLKIASWIFTALYLHLFCVTKDNPSYFVHSILFGTYYLVFHFKKFGTRSVPVQTTVPTYETIQWIRVFELLLGP